MTTVKEAVEAAKDAGKDMLERGAKNRTGAALSPKLTAEMEKAARDGTPPAGDERRLKDARRKVYEQAPALGSVPPPVRAKGMAGAAMHAVKGEHMAELIDELGARLAFERTGVRLYDALLTKMAAERELPEGMTIARAEAIRNEEAAHVRLVRDAIVELGGDPTVITPAADVQAVLSMGLPQVLTDPRTTVEQCLDAILVAELADGDSWNVLIGVTRLLGKDEMADRFTEALEREEEHLRTVRAWVETAARRRAGAEAAAAE